MKLMVLLTFFLSLGAFAQPHRPDNYTNDRSYAQQQLGMLGNDIQSVRSLLQNMEQTRNSLFTAINDLYQEPAYPNVDVEKVDVIMAACSNLSSYEDRSKCFQAGVPIIKDGQPNMGRVLLITCGNLGTYENRANCFQKGIDILRNHPRLKQLANACGGLPSYESRAKCFAAGIEN